MQGYRFDTFNTETVNQAAYDCLYKVANLAYFGKSPILIRGASGTGKTHLLWAIVNHLRSLEESPGLAFITPTDFPATVQRLASDPTPITGDDPAILLIDNLEHFVARIDTLQKVIRAFLDHNHCVVIACAEDDLASFPDAMRLLIHSGLVLPIQARSEQRAPSMVTRLQEKVVQLRKERDRLEADQARKAPQLQSLNVLQERITRLEAENQQLQNRDVDTAAVDVLKAQHKQVTAAMKREQDTLKDALNALTTERDALEAQLALKAGTSHDASEVQAQVQSLESALLKAGRESAVDKEQKQVAEQKLQTLEAELDTLAERFEAQEQEQQTRLRAAIQAADTLARQSNTGLNAEAQAAHENEMEEQRQQLEQTRQQLESMQTEHTTLQTRLSDANAQITRLQANQIDEKQMRSIEFELEKAHKHTALLISEMDTLRHEAAGQVALANMQAGETERRMHDLRTMVGLAREAGRSGAQETRSLQANAEQAAALLAGLARQLEAIDRIQVEAPRSHEPGSDQPPLFESLQEFIPQTNGTPPDTDTKQNDTMADFVQDVINLEERR